NGTFSGIAASHHMYSHAIATIALAEAYGMTGDEAKLMYPVQRAINYIIAAQGNNGSWGYRTKEEGDTSIVGWQIQALKSAEQCKKIQVNKKTLENATKFLNSASGNSVKSTYGYRNNTGANAGTALTAVGLLSRYYIDGWGPLHPGMADGVRGLITRRPPAGGANFDMYYYYYATQVVHFHDGEAWHKEWNPKMRDLLVSTQVANKGEKVDGSWDADKSLVGTTCGRLGTTCLALLTLEVYYRHLPLYKRDTGGMKELERGK
ncbi:MAG: prenyltransferase/squalene oxidase repeat-containing protein, partial [Gemmataceae bacterium]